MKIIYIYIYIYIYISEFRKFPDFFVQSRPCSLWLLFSEARGCRYEIIELIKEAETKVTDMLTQEDIHEAFQDANKTAGEETGWQLHKNAACNPEQVLAAAPHKTPTVRPPAPYHENYSSKTNQTCRTLLEKQRWTHKRCTLMDPHTWPHKSRTTSSNLHSAAMWGYRLLSWRPT